MTRVAHQLKAVSTEVETALYEVRRKIYPRAVHGWFARWRVALVAITQIIFYGLPWLSWNGRQAVLFDLAERKFYIFGLVLWPQDFIFLTGLLIIAAFSLFLFTALAGRLFCGYACPQTVYTEIFMHIERWIEGDRMVFGFGERHAILDGNVKRVLARLGAIGGYPGQKRVADALWEGAERLLPDYAIEAYTQGLMDLGAGICVRSNPRCSDCPVRRHCIAFATDRVANFPAPRPRRALPHKRWGMTFESGRSLETRFIAVRGRPIGRRAEGYSPG